MIQLFLISVLTSAIEVMKNKKHTKAYRFLTDEKTKNTVIQFMSLYAQLIDEEE
jgi:hypothetical protein